MEEGITNEHVHNGGKTLPRLVEEYIVKSKHVVVVGKALFADCGGFFDSNEIFRSLTDKGIMP